MDKQMMMMMMVVVVVVMVVVVVEATTTATKIREKLTQGVAFYRIEAVSLLRKSSANCHR